MKRRAWHIDFLFGLAMAVIIGVAYYFDGPTSPDNAVKPVRTSDDRRLLCVDGQSPENWICPDGTRL